MRTSTVQLGLFVLALLTGTVWVSGQDKKSQPKPDLSGTWRFDQTLSNVPSPANDELKITHHDPELRILKTVNVNSQPQQRELIYFTDGRGETNPATTWLSSTPDPNAPHPTETKSKTKWSSNKIVTRATIRSAAGGYVAESEVVDEWKLSADGKTLTHTTRITPLPSGPPGSFIVPANRPDDKRVYSLVSK